MIFSGKRADQVRVARKPGIVVGKKFLGGGGAADVIVLFEQENAEAQRGPGRWPRRGRYVQLPG